MAQIFRCRSGTLTQQRAADRRSKHASEGARSWPGDNQTGQRTKPQKKTISGVCSFGCRDRKSASASSGLNFRVCPCGGEATGTFRSARGLIWINQCCMHGEGGGGRKVFPTARLRMVLGGMGRVGAWTLGGTLARPALD
jgi:hypothetical protein